MSTPESAIRHQRVEYAREDTAGLVPDAPDFKLYSDNMTDVSWSPTSGVAERRGIGSPDVSGFFKGPEEHEITVTYDLQRFPVDAEGEPLDASGDGILRNANNALPNTHTVVAREENHDVEASETVNGTSPKDTRIYIVGVGGRVSDVSFSGDPSSEQPIIAELSYQFEKVREYQIDQPDAATALTVESTDASDEFEVTLEAEDGTRETLTLSGTTTVTTTETFGDLDAIDLADDPEGDVTVAEDGGDDLAVIRGVAYYDHGEGDEGVPALGAEGSRGAPVETSYETILGDEITRPDGEPVAVEINSVEFTVENDLDMREQINSPRMAISAGNRTVEVSTTVVGPTETVQSADDAFGNVGANVKWALDGGALTAVDSRLTDFGGVTKTEGEAAMSLDNTFTGETVDVESTA